MSVARQEQWLGLAHMVGPLGSGADDSPRIAAALALPSRRLWLTAGTFTLDAGADVGAGRWLTGLSQVQTSLELGARLLMSSAVGGVATTAQQIADLRITAPGATFKAVRLDAAGADALSGAAIRRVTFDGCDGGAIDLTPLATVVDSIVEDVMIKGCTDPAAAPGTSTQVLCDFRSPNETTAAFSRCYWSNNRDAADGTCLAIETGNATLVACIAESSGIACKLSFQAGVNYFGGHIEDMYGFVHSSQPQPGAWAECLNAHGVFFSRGPDPKPRVVLVQCSGLSAVTLRGCFFDAFNRQDTVIDSPSCEESQLDLTRCGYNNNCAPEFAALLGSRKPDPALSFANLATHSDFADGNHGAPSVGSTGIAAAQDLVTRLPGDAASQAITFDGEDTAPAAGTCELDNTVLSIFDGDTSDVLITFWAKAERAFSARVLWTGDADISNFRFDVGTEWRRYMYRAAAPAGRDTTIAAGMDGAVLPQAAIDVASTAAFPAAGTLLIQSSTANAAGLPVLQEVAYTGKAGATFTGCTGGTGTLATDDLVLMPGYSTGTYALFFEAPNPAVPVATKLSIARVQVQKVPRGAPFEDPYAFAVTGAAARTVAADVELARTIEGADPSFLTLQLPNGTAIELTDDGMTKGVSPDVGGLAPTTVALVGRTNNAGRPGVVTEDLQEVQSHSVDASLMQALFFAAAGMPANCGGRGTVDVVAHTDDYASVATFRVDVGFKVIAGVPTIVGFSPGSGAPLVASGALAGLVVAWQNVGGSDVSVVYTGAVATNISWQFRARVRYFT